MLLSGTSLSNITDKEIVVLLDRHGADHLILASDVASETLRRSKVKKDNPFGYIQAVCKNLEIPDWFIPYHDRAKSNQDKRKSEDEAIAQKKQEEELEESRNMYWGALSDQIRNNYLEAAVAGFDKDLSVSGEAKLAIAKLLAWDDIPREQQKSCCVSY